MVGERSVVELAEYRARRERFASRLQVAPVVRIIDAQHVGQVVLLEAGPRRCRSAVLAVAVIGVVRLHAFLAALLVLVLIRLDHVLRVSTSVVIASYTS